MRLLKFLRRLLVASFLVALFFVVTQDIQIFPGVISGLFNPRERDTKTLPEGVEATFVRTADNELLEVWHLRYGGPPDNAANHPVAVLFHGNAEDLETSYQMLRWLNSLGMAAIAFDYRGYGKSSGWPSDAGLKTDALAVVNLAESEYNLEEHPLILVGVSIGSGLAGFAAQHNRPDVLLLLSPYSALDELVGEVPIFGILKPFLWYDLQTSQYISTLKGVCLIAVYGSDDSTIPGHHAVKLVSNASNLVNRKLLRVEGAGHNDLMAKGRGEIEREIFRCLAY